MLLALNYSAIEHQSFQTPKPRSYSITPLINEDAVERKGLSKKLFTIPPSFCKSRTSSRLPAWLRTGLRPVIFHWQRIAHMLADEITALNKQVFLMSPSLS